MQRLFIVYAHVQCSITHIRSNLATCTYIHVYIYIQVCVVPTLLYTCTWYLYMYRVQCYEILQSDWSERGL